MSNPTAATTGVVIDPNSSLNNNGQLLANGSCVNRTSFQNDDPKLVISGLGKPGKNVVCPPNFNPLALTTPSHYAIQSILNLAAAFPQRGTTGFTSTEIFIEMNALAGTPVALDATTGKPALDASGSEFSTVQTPVKDANGAVVKDATGAVVTAPTLTYSSADVTSLLQIQTAAGVFCGAQVAGASNYLVNLFMTAANSANLRYDRPMGCSGNNTFVTTVRDPAKIALAAAAAAVPPATTRRALQKTQGFQDLQRRGLDHVTLARKAIEAERQAHQERMMQVRQTAEAARRDFIAAGPNTDAAQLAQAAAVRQAELEIQGIQSALAARNASASSSSSSSSSNPSSLLEQYAQRAKELEQRLAQAEHEKAMMIKAASEHGGAGGDASARAMELEQERARMEQEKAQLLHNQREFNNQIAHVQAQIAESDRQRQETAAYAASVEAQRLLAAEEAARLAARNAELERLLASSSSSSSSSTVAQAPASHSEGAAAQAHVPYVRPSSEVLKSRLDADGVYHLPYEEMLAGERGETLVFPQGARFVEVVFPDGSVKRMN